jgi:hypothetical protein
LGAIEPGSLQGFTGQESVDAVDARPLLRLRDKVLFTTMAENIDESADLRFLLLADGNGLVTSGEDLVFPAGQAGDLASQLREEVAHEPGELLAVFDVNQDM